MSGDPYNSGLPYGLTNDHLDEMNDKGYRPFNQAGIAHLQSQAPTTPTIASQFQQDIQAAQPMSIPQAQNSAPLPYQSGTSFKTLGTLANASGLTGIGSALGGATTSGIMGSGGLLAAIL